MIPFRISACCIPKHQRGIFLSALVLCSLFHSSSMNSNIQSLLAKIPYSPGHTWFRQLFSLDRKEPSTPSSSIPNKPFQKKSWQKELKTYFQATPIRHEYYIHGWQWHLHSVLHELQRMQKLVQKQQPDTRSYEYSTELKYIFESNWDTLNRIQKQIFFPWLQRNVRECDSLWEEWELHQDALTRLGKELQRSNTRNPHIMKHKIHQSIFHCQKLVSLHQEYMIGLIRRECSKSQQESLNHRIIGWLGLQARLHLVHMSQVADPREFRRQIPWIVRQRIPVWYEELYLPQIGQLATID